MTYPHSSLLFALGTIGFGLGVAGGCAKGSDIVPRADPVNKGGAGGTSASVSAGKTSAVAGSGTGGTSVAPCPGSERRCGPNCVDVLASPQHCGDCGRPCPAEARECVAGACVCPGGTHGVCDGICTDLRSDLSNCGACGKICSSDKTCFDGACVCDPANSQKVACGTKCVDLMTDPFHCGACNVTTTSACDAAQVCNQGVCSSTCTAPVVKCGAKCADLQSDSENCGECGKACEATRICSSGSCVCAPGLRPCGLACVDTQSDSANCGACGVACTPGTECSKGLCVCKSNATKCPVAGTGGAGGASSGVACVDTTVDPKNCGECANACNGAESCVESTCTCVAPNVECGVPPACTDPSSNPAHCGVCDHTCDAATERCEAGVCVCNPPNVDCGAGCVDISKSAMHCGACNQPCVGNQVCSSGTCVSGDLRVYTKFSQLPASETATSNQLMVSVRICNVGSSSADLGDATIRYWYSTDGAGGEQTPVLYSSTLDGVTLTAERVSPARSKNNATLTAKLPTDAVLAGGGACITEINMSVHSGTDWTPYYVVANDWSYLAVTDFALNDRVTMYIGVAKAWGNEPPAQ